MLAKFVRHKSRLLFNNSNKQQQQQHHQQSSVTSSSLIRHSQQKQQYSSQQQQQHQQQEHNIQLQRLVSVVNSYKRFNRRPFFQVDPHVPGDIYTETGAVKEMPKWWRMGLVKVVLNIGFFIVIGSLISRTCVTFLEENDIFKPEDDEEDDEDD